MQGRSEMLASLSTKQLAAYYSLSKDKLAMFHNDYAAARKLRACGRDPSGKRVNRVLTRYLGPARTTCATETGAR